MTEIFFHGYRDKDGTAHVAVGPDDLRLQELPPRLDLDNHSPTGLEWGYGGSGPAQLALAMLAFALDDDRLAMILHQKFKWLYIAKLPQDKEWRMSVQEVRDKAAMLAREVDNIEDRLAAYD